MYNYNKTLTSIILFILDLLLIISLATANGEDDDISDIAKVLGWVLVGLFSIAIFYVFFYQLFMKSRKIIPKNEKYNQRVEKIKNLYLKVKKPLSYLHYFPTVAAVVIMFFHGSPFLGNVDEKTIIGIIIGLIYLVYASIGVLLKTVLKKSKKLLKIRKNLFKFHTQLILLLIVGSLTIVHLVISA